MGNALVPALGITALGATDAIVASKDPQAARQMVKKQLSIGLIVFLVILGLGIMAAAIAAGAISSQARRIDQQFKQ